MQKKFSTLCRITSYNVCYTKLLRLYVTLIAYFPFAVIPKVDAIWEFVGSTTKTTPFQSGVKSVDFVITSYSIHYTKLYEIPFPNVQAEHIFEDRIAFAQLLDTIKSTGESYTIEVDDNSFDIYYGGYGSLEIGGEALEPDEPTLSSMNLNVERKSLEITLNPVPDDKVFWVLLPLEVISAEEAKYQLFIDGVETKRNNFV